LPDIKRQKSPRGRTRFLNQDEIYRLSHLSPMHLRTTAESFNGLTPDAAQLDQWAYKMAQNTKDTSEQEGAMS